MKKDKAKRITGFILIATILLLVGCSNNNYIEVESQDERTESDTAMDQKGTDIESEQSLNGNVEEWYSSDNIINYDEVIDSFYIPENGSREIVVGDYREDFPSELQEILIYLNDDVPEEDKDNAWREYEAECENEIITLEVDGYCSPFEDVSALVVDIDSDGEKEYIFSVLDGGTAKSIRTIVAKSINGEWLQIGGGMSDNSAVRSVLECGNQYYILMGDRLAYWNNEAEVPDWKKVLIPGQTECWNTIGIKKSVTGYTPLGIYGDLENESIDYLKDIDFTDLENSGAESVCNTWIANNYRFQVEAVWTQNDTGEEYRYIISKMEGATHYKNDLLLTVCRQTETGQMEIVTGYYLFANYKMDLVE